jgi:hypothetical protein
MPAGSLPKQIKEAPVPTLLEMQQAMQRNLLYCDKGAVSAMLADHIHQDRLDIYRNTFLLSLTKALQLCFPATQRLVGEDFFEGAAQVFITENPPRAAWLDQYSGEFPDFLRSFRPATSVAYLGDVAELEWAVNCVLHAPDAPPFEVATLGAIDFKDQNRICFVASPSIRLLYLEHPVDDIWRAVLAGDDEALRSVDIDAGPIHVLVERRATGIEVLRPDRRAWRFLSELCSGRPIEAAIDSIENFDSAGELAEHLALGRFSGFRLLEKGPAAPPHPTAA